MRFAIPTSHRLSRFPSSPSPQGSHLPSLAHPDAFLHLHPPAPLTSRGPHVSCSPTPPSSRSPRTSSRNSRPPQRRRRRRPRTSHSCSHSPTTQTPTTSSSRWCSRRSPGYHSRSTCRHSSRCLSASPAHSSLTPPCFPPEGPPQEQEQEALMPPQGQQPRPRRRQQQQDRPAQAPGRSSGRRSRRQFRQSSPGSAHTGTKARTRSTITPGRTLTGAAGASYPQPRTCASFFAASCSHRLRRAGMPPRQERPQQEQRQRPSSRAKRQQGA